MSAAPKFTPMAFARALRLAKRGACDDTRKARRASNVATRWLDRTKSPRWAPLEYAADRRRCVCRAYHFTQRSLRAALAKAEHAPGSTDEAIASGDAPYLVRGPGEDAQRSGNYQAAFDAVRAALARAEGKQ